MPTHVGQVRHHAAHYLEATILAQLEGVAHCSHGVTSVGIPRDVFVDTLHSDLDTRATITQHFVQMRFQTIIRPCLNSDSDTLGSVKAQQQYRYQIRNYVVERKLTGFVPRT